MQQITNSFEETQLIAESFAKTLRGGEVLCLYGDLGHGKTTFTQGLGKGLRVSRYVNSPTFIIMRSYKLPDEKTLYHVDLYRLEQEQEMIDIGLVDLMHNPDAIVVIEWPEKLGTLLPKKRIDIQFGYLGENVREITIHEYK
jgi:tRNA threonylcarbamoyladenosine biosynthesis protein TsaE